MSLIGPRPERPAFCAEFEKRIHGWHYRTMVTPGLSGLAQVTGDTICCLRRKWCWTCELGRLECDLARRGGEALLVVSRSVRRPLVGALVGLGADERAASSSSFALMASSRFP